MAILSDINSILLRIDPASFQQLGDELLGKIYHPTNIESRGSMIGKVKTKKGSPDAVLVVPNGKVLVEYTTQSSSETKLFIKKLWGDIESCLNEQKTKIPIDEIEEIILFVNQRISIDIQDELKKRLKSIQPYIKLTFYSLDDITVRIKDYPQLMSDYLGILDYSNLIELGTFIKKSSSQKFSLPIPLDNHYLEIEDFSLSQGLEDITTNDILVISGDAGMGKTRYAIELSKLYVKRTGAKSYVLVEMNKNVREVLDQIDFTTPYIFLIDDANRTSIWDETVEFYKNTTHRNIKIIATVRNYALDKVANCCSDLKTCRYRHMPEITDDFLKKVLESLGITNPEWHKRIVSITRHNIRLAVMCAQLALQGRKYNDLINVESVYDAYYKTKFEEVTPNHNNSLYIKVLSIISFYKVIDLSEEELLVQIENNFNISKNEFVNTCQILERSEFIDLTEDNIVTIPDQNFSNYIFYQCFFVLKELSLANLLEKFCLKRERLDDSIFSVWNCFHQESVIEYLKKSVSSAWRTISKQNGKQNESTDFLEMFGSLIPSETFIYVNELINKVNSRIEEPSIWGEHNIISILANFSHSEKDDIQVALTLMVDYLEVNPHQFENVKRILSEKWVYDDGDYLNDYKRSTYIIDSFISVASRNDIGFKLVSSVLPEYLKFVYPITKYRGRKYVFGRYPIYVTDALRLNRKKVWEWILSNIKKINQTVFITNLYTDFHEVKSIAEELILSEIPFLNNAIESFNLENDFTLCRELDRFSNRLKKVIDKDYLTIDWNNANRLYKLDKRIRGSQKQNIAHKIEVEKQNISVIIESKTLAEIIILLDELIEIANLDEKNACFRISLVIEELMKKDCDMALQVWQYSINKGYDYIALRIINSFFRLKYSIEDLIDFIKRQNEETRSNVLLDIVSNIDNSDLYISEQEFFDAIIGCKSLSYYLDFLLKKYFLEKIDNNKIRSVMAVILLRVRKDKDIMNTETFLQDFISRDFSKLNLIEDAYIYQIKRNRLYDYERTLFQSILMRDSYFWIKCCKEIKSFVKDCDIEPYNFICNLSNFAKIIESTLLFYSKYNWIPYDEKDNLYSFFSNVNDIKLTDFMDTMINKYCNDKRISSILFNIVSTCMGASRIQHYITFICRNANIEDFERLSLFPSVMYGGNSFAAAVKSNIEFVSLLIDEIKSLHNLDYLKHVSYLKSKKEQLEDEYKFELKRGHKYKLYDL